MIKYIYLLTENEAIDSILNNIKSLIMKSDVDQYEMENKKRILLQIIDIWESGNECTITQVLNKKDC